jgi:hypothetical protein
MTRGRGPRGEQQKRDKKGSKKERKKERKKFGAVSR